VPEDVKHVFVTAHDIAPHWHMQMQAAFQKHCDSSISKTINFSHDAKVEDVRAIYDLAVELDVKGVTVYRDGCRDVQPMALKGSQRKTDAHPSPALADTAFVMSDSGQLQPIRLPEIMPSLRIRQMTPFGNMHVKVAVDPSAGREREVFAQLGKGGDVANSDLEAICRLLSLWLRSNGSLDTALKQLEGIGSSLTVPTKDAGSCRSPTASPARCAATSPRRRSTASRRSSSAASRASRSPTPPTTRRRRTPRRSSPSNTRSSARVHPHPRLRRGLREVLRLRLQPVLSR
jgi:ribonucleoside-diphosphate reductase alpha chain